MNNDPPKLRHTQIEKSTSELHEQQQKKAETREFSSVDELLRHDAQQVIVPPGVAVKLNESISALPKSQNTPWWKRLFLA